MVNPYGGAEEELAADDGGEAESTTVWTLPNGLDLAAGVFIAVVLFRAIGGVLAALSTPSISFEGSAVLGPGQNVTVPDVSTYERLTYATGWADLATGVLLVLALLAVATPRLAWERTDKAWTYRGIGILIALTIVALMAAVGAGVGIYNIVDNPGLDAVLNATLEESAPVADAVGALLLAGITVVGSWAVWRWWAPDSPAT